MNDMKAVIVEDEASSRTTLKNYLNQYCPQVEIMAMAGDIIEGKQCIEEQKPDLVFLDVEMPFGNGFDLLESLEDIQFQTIFVTAYSHYAIQAIKYSAANYILKPIDIEELVKAVNKVQGNEIHSLNSTKVLLENIKNPQKQSTKIVLPVMEGFEIIQAKDIIRCAAHDNFTRFSLLDGQKLLICRTLKFYQELLEPLGFLRVHKSHMVNLEFVRKYVKGKGGSVILNDQSEVPVAPSRKSQLLNLLGAG